MFQAKSPFATLRDGKFIPGGTFFPINDDEVEVFKASGYTLKEVKVDPPKDPPKTSTELPKGQELANPNTTPPEGTSGISGNTNDETPDSKEPPGPTNDLSVAEVDLGPAPVLSGGSEDSAPPMGKSETVTAKATVTSSKPAQTATPVTKTATTTKGGQ